MRVPDLSYSRAILGDVLEILPQIPDEFADCIFIDPPFFLQLGNKPLERPEGGIAKGVDDNWDKFESLAHYAEWSEKWLVECKRVLKKTGTIWVMGTYHNIHTLGYLMQKIGFWFLNDITWHKNSMPNLHGTRFHNVQETLIWAQAAKGEPYCFNYQIMKRWNNGKQMPSIWRIPICRGRERIVDAEGVKLHSAQKPERLLHRVLVASTNLGDTVLDPMCGVATTLVVCKKLGRRYIGIDNEPRYVEASNSRLNTVCYGDSIGF